MKVRHVNDSDRIAAPLSAGNRPHACDVYRSRDFKCPSRAVLYNFAQFESLAVETASRDDKVNCQPLIFQRALYFLTVNVTAIYLFWYATVC
jgi:hypothetical protein